jgi:hypothetical protein
MAQEIEQQAEAGPGFNPRYHQKKKKKKLGGGEKSTHLKVHLFPLPSEGLKY